MTKPKTKKTNLPTFDTMQQCSAATGIPLIILKRSKRNGCPAFEVGSRVRLGDFLGWYFAQPGVSEIDLLHERGRLAKAEADKAERENKIAEGQLHSLADVTREVWTECLMPLRTELLSMPRILAPRCVDAEAAQTALQEWIDSTLAKILAMQPNVTSHRTTSQESATDGKQID